MSVAGFTVCGPRDLRWKNRYRSSLNAHDGHRSSIVLPTAVHRKRGTRPDNPGGGVNDLGHPPQIADETIPCPSLDPVRGKTKKRGIAWAIARGNGTAAALGGRETPPRWCSTGPCRAVRVHPNELAV
jgi:hypothetical protein